MTGKVSLVVAAFAVMGCSALAGLDELEYSSNAQGGSSAGGAVGSVASVAASTGAMGGFAGQGGAGAGGGGCNNLLHPGQSTPSDGVIDARIPHPPNMPSTPFGYTEVMLAFEHPFEGDVSCFSVEHTALGAPPGIASLSPNGTEVTLVLDRPIEPGAWTTIVYENIQGTQYLDIGYLPGDANQSGMVDGAGGSSPDTQHVNDCVFATCPDYEADIDRDTDVDVNDVSEQSDLAYGNDGYQVWSNQTLPPKPHP